MFTWNQLTDIIYKKTPINSDKLPWDEINQCFLFLKDFSANKVIYGINTGFGPMAQYRVDDAYLNQLQYNLIRSHACGAGNPLSDVQVRAAMVARLGTFLQAKSGVHPNLVKLLVDFINLEIYPFIPQHGSVGASGDLVQLAHIALTLIGEGKVHYQDEWLPTAQVMEKCGLKPFEICIREGLSVTNGTSVMTGISLDNQHHAENLLQRATLAAVFINEIAQSYDDMLSEPLNACRRHSGQQYIANQMRQLAAGSKRMLKREHELYSDKHATQKVFEHKVQAYYSLRCIPQIFGPIYDTLQYTRNVLVEEVNSACDNPIIDPQTQNVYHGGNFHGDYISLEEDKVKIAMVRLCMTMERQLNYLFHDRINGILPPFLNMGTLGLNYGLQACQFTATSTTAECQTLAMPNYVHSIPNNNDNQDIVSMGTNSALLCKRVLDNTYQVMAVLYMALAQATDCLGMQDQLSDACKQAYNQVRAIIPARVQDETFYEQIDQLITMLRQINIA
ncbi:MAG: aromatic amino acid ammonia-lyase [Paludibacteraceae bacterium]|nr:aromatic amino acid ammonia-lyase [Paludibacteraceae bacterium]